MNPIPVRVVSRPVDRPAGRPGVRGQPARDFRSNWPRRGAVFVDDALIESHLDLKRTLRQPIKEGGGRAPLV